MTQTENSVAIANAAAAHAVPTASSETAEAQATGQTPAGNEPSAPPVKVPPAILPDDVRPAIRPEDFLPYFQIPGAAQNPGDVTLLVPASPKAAPVPGTIPASSATYTQTPK